MTLGKLFHSDFFNLKNLKIGHLLIEGDYEDKGRNDQLLYNETNDIIRFKDKIILFKDKINSKYFDINNFIATENDEEINLGIFK